MNGVNTDVYNVINTPLQSMERRSHLVVRIQVFLKLTFKIGQMSHCIKLFLSIVTQRS